MKFPEGKTKFLNSLRTKKFPTVNDFLAKNNSYMKSNLRKETDYNYAITETSPVFDYRKAAAERITQ